MHLFDPISETIEDHAADNGMIPVECVSRAAVIRVARAVLCRECSRCRCRDRESSVSALMVAFGGVIENDVENHLDAGPVQRLHHVAKFVYGAERILARAVGLVGREERDRRIAPVVDRPGGRILRVKVEHRQEFDGGNAEFLKIRNLFDQAGISAACASGSPELGWRVKPRTCIS